MACVIGQRAAGSIFSIQEGFKRNFFFDFLIFFEQQISMGIFFLFLQIKKVEGRAKILMQK